MIVDIYCSDIVPRRGWLERYGLNAWWNIKLIRDVESRLPSYVQHGYINGSTHQSIGMEAIAVGVSASLRRTDLVTSTHRGHAHFLAKGGSVEQYLAELFGRSSGICGGRGGSMLLADPGSGVLATDAIVGEGIGIATGAALALSLRNSDDVVVSYFGDGAVNEGIFHASLNIAALWRLPCVFVCENNHYAKSCSVDEMVAGGDLAKFADVHGIAGITIDGMDVFAVWEAARNAVTHARAGQGPTMIVADTYRFCGHSVGDTEIYRPKDEVEAWSLRDPVLTLERELLDAQLVDEDQLAALRERLANTIDAAETHALAAPGPDPATALAHVYWGG